MTRCLIVDDEEMCRVNLRIICEQVEGISVVAELDSALDALAFLKENTVDLLLLDIEMPNFSGMDLVRSIDYLPGIIFISSKENYAATAFDYLEQTVDYIVKPVSRKRLLLALQRFQRLHPPALPDPAPKFGQSADLPPVDDFIFIKTERRYVRVNLDDLLYVEINGDYSIFKTVTGQHIVNTPLKQINDRLEHPNFIQVHRSYIVNITKVVDIEDNNLLINGKIIPISRSQRGKLMERIMPI